MSSTHLAFISMPGGMEWLIILLVALLLFGKNLPKVMRELGRSVRTFKEGMGLEDPAGPFSPYPRNSGSAQPLSRHEPIDQDLDNLILPNNLPDHTKAGDPLADRSPAASPLASSPPPVPPDDAFAAAAGAGLPTAAERPRPLEIDPSHGPADVAQGPAPDDSDDPSPGETDARSS